MTKIPRIFLLVTLPLYVIDQITKWLIVLNFERGEYRVVIDGFFNLVRVHNQGVAFGFGNNTAWAPVVFLAVPVIALGVLGHFWRRGAFETPLMRLAAALLVAGILGNLTDRLVQGFALAGAATRSFWENLSKGYVVDFLDFKLPLYGRLVPASGGHWPSFNVADSCICVAAFLLILSTFRDGKPADPQEAGTEDGTQS